MDGQKPETVEERAARTLEVLQQMGVSVRPENHRIALRYLVSQYRLAMMDAAWSVYKGTPIDQLFENSHTE